LVWLRVSGWLAFLVGGGVFLWQGGFSEARNPFVWAGMFVMLLGMILTSLSNLAAHFVKMRTLRKDLTSKRPEGR
jgi:hypothetical protein